MFATAFGSDAMEIFIGSRRFESPEKAAKLWNGRA